MYVTAFSLALASLSLTLTTSVPAALAPTAQNGSPGPLAVSFPARSLEIPPRGGFWCVIRNADGDVFVAPW